MSKRFAALLVLGVVCLPPVALASPSGRCSGRKLKATAMAARGFARCHAEAAARGAFLDSACVTAAVDPLDVRFAAAESVGGCATSGDAADIRSRVEFAVNDVAALIRPGLEADACASQKLRGVGAKLSAILSAHAAAVRSGDAGRLAGQVARAGAHFTAAFARSEQRHTCVDPGDAATVEGRLDGAIATLRGKLAPLCGDGVRAGVEACDGVDSSACPGRCLAGCTCQQTVCGDGVREGSEVCDGSDDAACPGQCQADCRCPDLCGNGVLDGSEQCDGANVAACSGARCQLPGLSGECQCCSTGFCFGGFPGVCCGASVRCVLNDQSPVGVCTPFGCTQPGDCGVGSYDCQNGSCCAQPGRSCINIGCCPGSTCTFALGTPHCCLPAGVACSTQVPQACCSGSCNAGTSVCD